MIVVRHVGTQRGVHLLKVTNHQTQAMENYLMSYVATVEVNTPYAQTTENNFYFIFLLVCVIHVEVVDLMVC